MASEPGRPGSDGAPDQDPPGAPGTQGNQNGQDPAPADAQAGGQAPADEKKQRRKRPFWRDLVVIVVAALALTILLKAFVVEVFSIPSGSMENTLLPGDRVLVSKIVYRFRDIARGDVVVFSGQGSWGPDAPPPPGNPFLRLWDDLTNLIGVTAPGTDYIKRVIGLPGDHVVCCDAQGRITVNGVPLSEQSYIHPGDVPSSVPFDAVVPAGRLWVMGDNRADSDDSRYRTSRPGRRDHPGERGRRPRVRDHLAAITDRRPAHSRHIPAGGAARHGCGARRLGRHGRRPDRRRPRLAPPPGPGTW